ncbi:Tryp_SPc [Nesidiocoris tenuis]|uniref:Tryp_SPc n=1 Tax=Nesidiocoris tenuis TaxID=355587 RepID=A0ABN7BEJ9_9HEMI|nr:Tryp_SPc [Nesidiocoris tenuis]
MDWIRVILLWGHMFCLSMAYDYYGYDDSWSSENVRGPGAWSRVAVRSTAGGPEPDDPDLNSAVGRGGRSRQNRVSPAFQDGMSGGRWLGDWSAERDSPDWSPPPAPPPDDGEGRHISRDTLKTITETLGAINTVGRYLVNYTRSEPTVAPLPERTGDQDLPGAIYTISKNVLGRNMTDTIAPLVRGLPIGKVTKPGGGGNSCQTPQGAQGTCEDLSNCPQLLLDLASLRQSICFKSLFVPGVCCPVGSGSASQHQQQVTTTRPPAIYVSTTTRYPTVIRPVTTRPTYQRPPINPDEDLYQQSSNECGVPEVAKFRVVGGEEALPGRWPWMAAIFLHGPRRTEFWCGGSLISEKHILTAAHCTKDTRQRPFSPRQFTVRLGDIDLKRDDEPSSPQTFHVSDIRAHPKFSRVGFYNDIAVLVLEKKVKRSRYVKPLCLPPNFMRDEQFLGRSPSVVGWGTTYYGGKESTVQRQVDLPVWKNEECDKTYFQPINENFICAGLKEGGKDACQGDSGGPLMLKDNGRWMQIGIVSFGNKCGEPGYPGVYTRVTKYTDWINKNLV